MALVTGRLHALLTRSEMSARQLAKLAGLPKTTVTDVLSGKTEPTLGVMVRLVHAFGLRSIEELVAPFGTAQIRRAEFGPEIVT